MKESLPTLEPEVVGSGPIQITDGLASSIRAEVAPAMSNAVAQDLMRDTQEQEPEESALGDLASEKGQGAAPPAPPAAPGAPPDIAPDQEQASRELAEASGGQALPGDVKEEAEQALGADLSDVKIHVNEPAVESIDAGAAAIGKNVFFAPGAFDTASDEGKALVFHELAHAKDASPTSPGGDLTLGGTDTGAEAEADAVYEAVRKGEPVPEIGDAGGDGNTIRRGEAGVHQNDITMPGMGVNPSHLNNPENPNGQGNDFRLGGFRHRDSGNLSPDQRAALQVYAGNFMSDFSQANVPKALDMLSNVPTMRNGEVTTIGAQGAGIMLQSLVRAFAILELGTEAAALVTAQTTEMYEAERHIDNPMGTSAADYVVANEHGTAIATAETPPELLENPATAIRTTDPTPEQLAEAGVNRPSGSWHEQNGGARIASGSQPRQAAPTSAQVQQATAETHAGSAVPGMQFDNPALFQVSDAGLANHIYNSIESSKRSYLNAAQAGPTPIGRMHVGYADHIVQDYFSHSNFIEVALNTYIGDALAERQSGGGDHGEHDHDHEHEEHEEEGHEAPHSSGHDADHDHDHGHADGHGSDRPQSRDEFLDRMAAQGPLATTQGQNDLVSPQFVATMYNAQSAGGIEGANGQEQGPRDAITTGSFGASDTMISLAHIFVPMIPKLHESMERSIGSFLGVVESAPPGADWPLITDMLTSSGRDGAVLHTMLQGLSDAGVAVSVPSGVGFEWSSVAISPGWFGDPWTVNVPSGVALEYSDMPLATAVGTFSGIAARINELKRDLQGYARYIGLDSVARAIDRVWTAAKEKFKQALKAALQKVILTILQTVTEQLNGTAMTPREAQQFASGGIENALSLANEAMHGAEERTSIAYRLNEGDLQQGSRANTALGSGDMDGDGQTGMMEQYNRDQRRAEADTDGDGLLSASEESAWVDAQKAELERRVGPVRGSGTTEDPWVPLAPLPPSHSEIGKDHPPHAPGHHEHEHHEHDHNPEMLNPGSAPVRILPDEPQAHEHEHEHEHEEHDDGGAGGHDHEHGSSFFGLGVALAVEAQRHLYKQMETVWQQTTGDSSRRFADLTDARGDVVQSGASASEERDRGMQVEHDDTLTEARAQSARERERNRGRGFRRTEDSSTAQGMVERAPAFADMTALVDLYMSHPNDSRWWRSVMDSYVSANPGEVYEHILRRNRMAMSQQRRLT